MSTFAAVAQPAEHLTSIQDVAGSTPACGSIFHTPDVGANERIPGGAKTIGI